MSAEVEKRPVFVVGESSAGRSVAGFEELSKVDALLDYKHFFNSFRKRFPTYLGKPTVPPAPYTGMMCLSKAKQTRRGVNIRGQYGFAVWCVFRLALK